jgi:hypothetical protein
MLSSKRALDEGILAGDAFADDVDDTFGKRLCKDVAVGSGRETAKAAAPRVGNRPWPICHKAGCGLNCVRDVATGAKNSFNCDRAYYKCPLYVYGHEDP